MALYRDPVLQEVLPQMLQVNANAGGAVRSRSGYPFPPRVVLERGTPLAE